MKRRPVWPGSGPSRSSTSTSVRNPGATHADRVGRNDDPPLNADLHIAQSDIRPLIRDQLRMLQAEIEAALERGVGDRMTRIHLEDALERIRGSV